MYEPFFSTTQKYWLDFLISRVNKKPKIIFTDGSDSRIIEASYFLLKKTSIQPILIGDSAKIYHQAYSLGKSLDGVEIYSFLEPQYSSEWSNFLLSNSKLTLLKDSLLENSLAFGSFLLKIGVGQGLIAGASVSTGEVIKRLLSIVGVDSRTPLVTSSFVMIHPNSDFASNGLAIFSDCGVIPEPTEEQLFEITLRAQRLMMDLFNISPRTALLSFSSSGSSTHPAALKMRHLKERLKAYDPAMEIAGEIQFDAAADARIRQQKGLSGDLQDNANVYIFPNLDSGNIGYKIMQHTSGSLALGPLLQGFPVRVSDLSRGCTVEDIVLTSLVTACQS